MKPISPGASADLIAAIALNHAKVSRAVAARILDLADGGLSDTEVAHVTGYALALVRLVLRGGNLAFTREKFERRVDRPSLTSLRFPGRKR